jgi:hypothetical protein
LVRRDAPGGTSLAEDFGNITAPRSLRANMPTDILVKKGFGERKI